MRGEEDRVNARNQENLVRYKTCLRSWRCAVVNNTFCLVFTHTCTHRLRLVCLLLAYTLRGKLSVCSSHVCRHVWNVGEGNSKTSSSLVTDSHSCLHSHYQTKYNNLEFLHLFFYKNSLTIIRCLDLSGLILSLRKLCILFLIIVIILMILEFLFFFVFEL